MKIKQLSFRKTIIFFALSAACLLAGGLSLNASVPAAAANGKEYTYILGEQGTNTDTTFYEPNFAAGWNRAVAHAVEIASPTGADSVRVTLGADWLADETEAGDSTSFGLGEGFENGMICVPKQARITLDLNGNFIERGLGEFPAQESGSVFYVEGKLTVEDGNPSFEHTVNGGMFQGGAITGGNALNGGGVFVAEDGSLTLNGGSVYLNHAVNGGGVYGALYLNGGAITENTAEQGGGVYANRISLNGGTISNNTAEQGGGIYTAKKVTVNQRGGVITNNQAQLGGGIFTNHIFMVCGGEIRENTATYGGGAYAIENGVVFVDENSRVAGNVATEDGGGVYVINNVNTGVIIEGGITGNRAKNGGGIYLANGGTGSLRHTASVTGNTATEQGGGVYLKEEGELRLYESPSVSDNNGNNLYLTDGATIKAWELTDAQIYLTVAGSESFTLGYEENNLKSEEEAYAVSPATFFTCDDESKKIILNADGELVCADAATHPTNWSVGFGSGTSQAFEDEYGVTLTYGENTVTAVALNEQNCLLSPAQDAGTYWADYTYSPELTVRFTVAILPRTVSDGAVTGGFADGTTSLSFTGEALTPQVALAYRGTSLVEGSDYTVVYENNKNAGTARAVVHGTGNFSGEKILEFDILPSETLIYTVSWETLGTDGWEAYTDSSLTFNMTDLRSSLRARLTAGNITEFVYYDTPYDQTDWNANLFLDFGTDEVAAAGSYTVQIAGVLNGQPNGTLDQNKKTIVVNASPLSVREDSFADYEDGQGNRLWLLDGGERLRDAGTVYFDPSAPADEYGNTVATGTLNDAYARFLRADAQLVLSLNGNYLVGGIPLSSYFPYLEIDYAGSNRAAGSENGVVRVDTAVTLTFDSNFTLEGGGNTLTLHKTWYIVVINNSLTNADGSLLETALGDVTYGKAACTAPRPEHGRVAIYSIDALYRFAAVFASSGADAEFYGVRAVSRAAEEWQVDYNNRLGDDYFNRCLNRLSAGSYTLTVHVPQQEAEGAVYYAFTQAFTFRVLPSTLEEGGGFTGGVSYFLLQDEVFYNGKTNNTPRINLTYERKTLREGADYVLESGSMNVGAAELTVRGIGNYAGTVFLGNEVYRIVRATNVWAYTPSVFGWTAGDYERAVNRFQAVPALLDEGEYVWFGVYYDEHGKQPVAGLGSFTAANGMVSDGVAERLKALPAGDYYVKATVEPTENYTGLSPAPNLLTVGRAANAWIETPNMLGWEYRSFDKTVHLLRASVRHGSLSFVLQSGAGEALSEEFTLEADGTVPDEIAEILLALPVGTYKIVAAVSAGDYAELEPQTAVFSVTQAVNAWTLTPGINPWVTGEYSEIENIFYAEAKFGNVRFRIALADDEDYVIFDTEREIDLLKDAKAGTYVLTAYVADGAKNYSDLSPFMVTFRIFPPAGMPWWGTLLVVAGVLGVLAVVFFILQKKGVLQVLSGKMVIAIRAKAAADATIAAVRANKRAEEAKESVARAEEEDEKNEE